MKFYDEQSKNRARYERIEDAITLIEKTKTSLDGVSVEAFVHDLNLCDAILYRNAIVGETLSRFRIGEEFQDTHPGVDWEKVTNNRNSIIHDYYVYNPKRVLEDTYYLIDTVYPQLLLYRDELQTKSIADEAQACNPQQLVNAQ